MGMARGDFIARPPGDIIVEQDDARTPDRLRCGCPIRSSMPCSGARWRSIPRRGRRCGEFAARRAHRNRLPSRTDRRDGRPARAAGATLAPYRDADQACRGSGSGLAGVDAGTDPARVTQRAVGMAALKWRRSRAKVRASTWAETAPGEKIMKRIWAASAITAVAALVSWASLAIAAPPTVTPSPGYDARLQEQRRMAAPTVYEPAGPTPRPAARRRVKRVHGAY